jgi:hypothetical protein
VVGHNLRAHEMRSLTAKHQGSFLSTSKVSMAKRAVLMGEVPATCRSFFG